MNLMSSYKIYLTKSHEVAARISRSFCSDGSMQEGIRSVNHGKVQGGNELIPAIYHNKGYSCCVVELEENGEHDAPTYELTIC